MKTCRPCEKRPAPPRTADYMHYIKESHINRFDFHRSLAIICLMAGLTAFGCTSVYKGNMLLEKARATFLSVQADPQVRENAPLELDQAEIAFALAEGAVQTGAGVPEIEHLAYLAQRKSSIAMETAALRLAEKDVATAIAERDKMLLEAQITETRRALAQAREERLAAEKAYQQEEGQRMAAEKALKQAKDQAEEAEKARKQAVAEAAEALRLERQLAELQASRTERGLVVTLGGMLFDSGKSDLKTGGFTAIDQLAAFLNEYPTRRVQIEGFTDNVGDSKYNLSLSIQRAEAVRDALSHRGVALERMLIEGYGEEFPAASNDTAEGRRRNRRVEVIISDERGDIPDRVRRPPAYFRLRKKRSARFLSSVYPLYVLANIR